MEGGREEGREEGRREGEEELREGGRSRQGREGEGDQTNETKKKFLLITRDPDINSSHMYTHVYTS